jgi:DNA polymerase-3 subunit epsilon
MTDSRPRAYAVIDLETTGLRTSWHDRVVEVAIVALDASGRVADEWCSLINPDRDLGPQDIHGISAAEARRAPAFADLAGEIAVRLAGLTVVAHNLAFDAPFLAAEFGRIGATVPLSADHGLCTMSLARHFLPAAGRSLEACRTAAGLPAHRAHSALHDARAAADLLAHYLRMTGSPPPWSSLISESARTPWPAFPAANAVPAPRRRPGEREPHFLTRLVDRLPRSSDPRGDAYLDLLDRALIDRHISAGEADELVATADQFDLSRADVDHLHRGYLAGLASVALEDGVVSTDERRDLDAVAGLLGLGTGAVDEALAMPRTARNRWQLHAGDLVVFTGAMQPAREEWQAEAAAAGLVVGDNVTKNTRLQVAADPDSMSGKAKKARQYRIPIVHPLAYREMLAGLGAMV